MCVLLILFIKQIIEVYFLKFHDIERKKAIFSNIGLKRLNRNTQTVKKAHFCRPWSIKIVIEIMLDVISATVKKDNLLAYLTL